MSSPITQALVANIAASMDPMNAMTRQFMAAQVDQMQKQNAALTSELVESVAAKLKAAYTNEEPPAVKNAYEKLLASLTK